MTTGTDAHESEPTTELDATYSSSDAMATPWATGRDLLERAEVFWLSTVRPDGRPHVTPLISVWLDGAPHFCTGAEERKAQNLRTNQKCILTTGVNSLSEGLDVVVEGEALRVTDEAVLKRLAAAYDTKYEWHFDVRDGAFVDPESGNVALVFRVEPAKAFGYSKGEPGGATRWRF